MNRLIAQWASSAVHQAPEEAKLKGPPSCSPQALLPSTGPESDPVTFRVPWHLKGHCPTLGPSDTVLLLRDTLPEDVPATLLGKH